MTVTTVVPFAVSAFATHYLPHFDEILACFFFWNFPHPDFVGADEAPIEFYNAGRKTFDGQYATEAWVRAHRKIALGIWQSEFDEHRREGETDEEYEARREKQECASFLVAKRLGLDQLPEFQAILRFARRVDNTATADPRDISSVIKRLHDNREAKPHLVTKYVKDQDKQDRIMELIGRQISLGDMFLWVEQGIYAKYLEDPTDSKVDDFSVDRIGELLRLQSPEEAEGNEYSAEEWLQIGTDALELDQLLFETVVAAEYTQYKVLMPFRGKNKKGQVVELKIAFVSSDVEGIHRRARFEDHVAVTIQRRNNGTVVIQSNKYYNIKMYDVARIIKTVEHELRGLEPPRWDEMKRELLHGVWHYFQKGEALFNGSKTAPDTDPTRIPPLKLVELVKMGLSVEVFEPSRSETCLQGICSSTRSRPCPWYKYGLSRCQTIRWEERRDREAAAASGK